ncbi:ABC transporter substrate-binding protein [Paenibacillus dakarensis]|uniref:ABC transporter substrate-binding protein n=1 Tax=Paenibacillus dakarensis TaxID=1527293 RepID=UPI0006D54E30|nr:extracellular solute-binding protein [Paenibacillus dakarensis]
MNWRRLVNWGWIILYVCLLGITVMWALTQNRSPLEEEQAEKITLSFRHFWNREHDRQVLEIVESVVRKYQETHPNIKINFEGVDQTSHRELKLKSEMVTGTPPDMFVLFGGAEIEPYVRSNRLMDLTEFLERKRLKLQFQDLSLWTFDEGIYGLPLEGHAEPLYYNKTIFNRLNIPPPETLDQLNEAVRVLKANGIIPFALGNEERWPAAIFAQYVMDRYAGPELIQKLAWGEEQVSFRNAGYEEALRQLELWIKEGSFSPSSNTLSTEEAVKLFTEGKAAMYLNGNWDINLFRSKGGSVRFQEEVGVIPFPVLTEGEGRSMAGGYTIGIGLSSDLNDSKKAAALELLEDLYTEEVQTRIVYEGLRIPSMKIDYDSNRTGPVFAQVIRLMEQSPSSFLPYDNVISPELNKTFLEVLANMLEGNIGAAEALEQIQNSSERYWRLRDNAGSDEAEGNVEHGNG